MNNIIQKVSSVVDKISSNKYMKSLMQGMMMFLPLTITGAIGTLIKILPIEAYQTFLITNGIDKILDIPLIFTTNIIALLASLAIAYALASHFKVSQMATALVSMVSFLILSPIETNLNDWGQMTIKLPFDFMGSQGLFTAILVAFTFGRLFIFFTEKKWTIKMPDSVPPFIAESFSGIIPAVLVISFATLVSSLIAMTPFGNVHNIIYGMLQAPLQKLTANLSSVLIVSVVAQLLWFFGIHGSSITMGVVAPIWATLDMENLAATSAGLAPTNIIGMNFFNVYSVSNVLPLAIMFIFMAKSKQYKTLGKLSAPPQVFGIGEPLVFGVPLVMNFRYFIPYVFADAVVLAVAFLLTKANILPVLSGISAPFGTPVILSGLIAGGWKVALFQVVAFALRFAIYWPFFKNDDKKVYLEEVANEAK